MPVWRVFSPSSPPRPLKPAPSVPHRPQKGLAQSFPSLGSDAWVCGFTRSDGVMEIGGVPVGMRRTWVEPPEGYVQESDPLEQVVEVVKDRTTQVEFTLVRTP